MIDYSIIYGRIEKLRFVRNCGPGATACWSFHNCHPPSVILATLVLVVDKDWSWAARLPTNEKVIQTYNTKEMTRTEIELIEYLGLQRIVFLNRDKLWKYCVYMSMYQIVPFLNKRSSGCIAHLTNKSHNFLSTQFQHKTKYLYNLVHMILIWKNHQYFINIFFYYTSSPVVSL